MKLNPVPKHRTLPVPKETLIANVEIVENIYKPLLILRIRVKETLNVYPLP